MTTEPGTSAISPFVPLSEVLKAPLRKEDLEFDVGDGQFLADFENAWAGFLRDNPDLVPKGAREERILDLQREARKEEEAKLKIIKEMEQQLEFFKASCEALEEMYSGKMQAAIEIQSQVHEDLQKRLEDASSVDKIQGQTLPWHHFLYEVDLLAANAKSAQSGKSRKTVRPSDRAMVLTDHSRGCPGDVVLRAYKIDHALMTNHIRMLTKDIDRYKKLARVQEMAGKFLKDFDAWGVLSMTPSQDDSSSGDNSLADPTGPKADY